jgi:hypothetical protein
MAVTWLQGSHLQYIFEQSLRSACEGSGDETGKPDGID